MLPRIVQGLLAIVVLFAGRVPVAPTARPPGQTLPMDFVVPFSDLTDVLWEVGRIVPEITPILDFIYDVLSAVSRVGSCLIASV